MHVVNLRDYEALSPFEIKDELIRLARERSQRTARMFLDAGRGNPNWVATNAREAFFLLGQFAISESKRVMDQPGLGGMPVKEGSGERLRHWLSQHANTSSAGVLANMVTFAVQSFQFDQDEFVYELTDGILGDNYPSPQRMLPHAEQVVQRYLCRALAADGPVTGLFDLYAVEGATAAICYVFKSLMANRLLGKGDTVAVGTPIFPPYLEIPALQDYALNTIYIEARQEDGYQYTEAALAKLLDPAVKAFLLVNPGNPTSVALSAETLRRLTDLVINRRPELILLTDDVYATFVSGYRSLLTELPHNTIGIYSYSKYFGCTGWRLGVIALHETNILDRLIAHLPEADKEALDKRYSLLTHDPRKLKMIDRIVADSRDVALRHTAGLSPPQQVMMTLLSLAELMDTSRDYQSRCINILHSRLARCVEGLGMPISPGPLFAAYYGEIDFEFWLRQYAGPDVVDWIKQNVHPLDIVFRLAEDYGIVVLNGGGFKAPNWSCRVSFANLDDEAYENIGRALRAIAEHYVQAYRAQTGLAVTPPAFSRPDDHPA